MRRIATIIFACLAVALMGAAMAVASSGNGPGNRSEDSTTSTTGTTTTPGTSRRAHPLEGRVVAIDATAKTFDLKVRRHHRRGKTVTIKVTDATLYRNLPNGFDSIALRDRLKVKASKIDGVLTASKVAKKNKPAKKDDSSNDSRRGGSDDGPNHDANDDHGGNSGRGGSNGSN